MATQGKILVYKRQGKKVNCTPKVGHKTTFGGAVFL